jgi:hypothetical protein
MHQKSFVQVEEEGRKEEKRGRKQRWGKKKTKLNWGKIDNCLSSVVEAPKPVAKVTLKIWISSNCMYCIALRIKNDTSLS